VVSRPNILAVLASSGSSESRSRIRGFGQEELRVRQEALKVLFVTTGESRAITEALESGELYLARMAARPPRIGLPAITRGTVIHVLSLPDEELALQAIRGLAESGIP